MTTTFAFHGLRRMSVLSLLVAVNAVMLLSCRADAQQNIKRIKMEKENLKEIYLAGGSFWGTEHYLKQIDGVVDTEVGFANGTTANPTYKEVCTDKTGFAETVHVTYDPAKVSLKFLLEMYFKAIDPTSISTAPASITPTRMTRRLSTRSLPKSRSTSTERLLLRTSLYRASTRRRITIRIISTRIPTATAICRKACSSLRARQRTQRNDTQ